MRLTVVAALLPALVAAEPPWYYGAPGCASSCLSSVWQTSSAFPAPTAFCSDSSAASCLSSACGASPTVFSTFSSLSSSVCSAWSSCSSAGSTGVYTLTATGSWSGGGPWGSGGDPGGYPGGGPFRRAPGGPGGGQWGPPDATRTYSAGVYTVTGCPYDGSPWLAGGWGPGWWSGGAGPWGSGASESGWSYQTQTGIVTATYTSSGIVFTTTGLATVAQAISGSLTSSTTIGTVVPTANAAAGPDGHLRAVKAAGAVLGGVVGVAALL